MSQTLQERIAIALVSVVNPRTGANVVSSEMIRDIATTTTGRVRLTIFLAPDDPATLVRDVREAIERLDGVADVRVDVKDPSEANGGLWAVYRHIGVTTRPGVMHQPSAAKALPNPLGRVISAHPFDNVLRLGTEYRLVFED